MRSITMPRRLPTSSASGSRPSPLARDSTSVATARPTLFFVVVMAGPPFPNRRAFGATPRSRRQCSQMQRPRLSSLVGASIVLAACGTPSASESVAVDPSDGVPSATATAASSTPHASIAPSASTPTAADPPPIGLAPVADGFENPIGITAAPGGWLLVNEQRGLVLAVHPERGERARALDIVSRISSGGERGLLGLALHPDWPDVGRAFVHYTDLNGNTVLSEVSGTQDGDGPPVLDHSS